MVVLNNNEYLQVAYYQNNTTYNYDLWGNHRNPANWELSDFTGSYRGYTGHEHLPDFQLINMNGRMYDPVIGRVLSPDNYVQDATNAQDYNRYSYARNNPLKYTDPDGEWIHIVIGAIVGAINGGIIGHQAGLRDWKLVGAIFAGAAIGAGTAGIGTAISSSISGAGGMILSGAVAGGAGAASFNTLSGISNGVSGGDLVSGHFRSFLFGSISGAVGGTVSGAIGGGWGAFAGGVASNLTNQGLNYLSYKNGNTENFKFSWLSPLLSGGMSAGMYHINLAYHYKNGDINATTRWTYKQFAKNMAYTQRSMFWNLEARTITNWKGDFNVAKLGNENNVSVKGSDYIKATSDYHTHQDWGYNLTDGEGFSMCNSDANNYQSDEGARTILNMIGGKNIPMFLGTKEGYIWYMNGNFDVGRINNFNFSRIFSPYNPWIY